MKSEISKQFFEASVKVVKIKNNTDVCLKSARILTDLEPNNKLDLKIIRHFFEIEDDGATAWLLYARQTRLIINLLGASAHWCNMFKSSPIMGLNFCKQLDSENRL